ncbi:MAG: glycosyltransferase family 4 protein, partial [Actinomycetota bacterium]
MRILVYPNRLTVGGLQIIAIELAAAVRDRGHEVVVFCGSGPLVQLIRERRLRFVAGDVPRRPRPSPRVMRALGRLVEREHIDLVHAHGTAAALEAFYGAHLLAGVPTVASHMTSIAIPRHLPTTIPLIVGTREIQEAAQPTRAGRVELLEPPVNTEEDHPSVDGSAFRRAHGLDDGRLNVVVVSRLSPHLKQEGLERAIDAVASLAEEEPARLVIVGDGESRRVLAERADRVNRRLGWTAVVLAGELLDPRPAYAAADVVLGMGGSILRGMAFGKPAIVLGQGG